MAQRRCRGQGEWTATGSIVGPDGARDHRRYADDRRRLCGSSCSAPLPRSAIAQLRIQGDPTKPVGIRHNPLYRGKLVWGRREWRKNPDSDRRERRYRLRDEKEWIRVEVPELRIVDEELWTAAQRQIERARRAVVGANAGRANRRRHLLSGSIHRGLCGSKYVISGKDYYRCAGHKERGTCGIAMSVRKNALETVALSTLREGLLTDEHLCLYVDEFRRELGRFERERTQAETTTAKRIAQVEAVLGNLTSNMLAGVIGPTLQVVLGERERELERLRRDAREDATDVVRQLIETVTISRTPARRRQRLSRTRSR